MKTKFFNKKGVSPLIATVLLIAFAVSLGVVVMNWGKDYVETTATQTKDNADTDLACHLDIDMGIKEIGKVKKICYNGSGRTIEMMLENSGRISVDGLRIIAIDSDDKIDEHNNNTFAISAGSISPMYIYNYTDSLGTELQYLEIIPLIDVKGKSDPQPCLASSIKIEEITACN